MTDKPTAVIGVSDLHINSKVALCTPTVSLDEDDTHRSSRGQRWLWQCWLEFWDTVRVDYQGWRKILVINGDMGELDTKRRSYQIITPNKAIILDMVLNVLAPALDVVDSVYVVRGTQAHVGKSAWLEEAIARDLDHAVRHDGSASWWHIRGKIDGIRYDISHHASMGGLPWNAPNAANKLAAKTIWQYRVKMNQPAPDVIWRSHNHRWADSGKNYDPTYALCLPCWSLATEYAYRIGAENDTADIGAVVDEIKDGIRTERRFKFEPRENRQVWQMSL